MGDDDDPTSFYQVLVDSDYQTSEGGPERDGGIAILGPNRITFLIRPLISGLRQWMGLFAHTGLA